MRKIIVALPILAGLALGACAKKDVAVAPPPPPPGAVPGSTAADRDGDGIVDGYYTSDGIYHPNYVAPTVQPATYQVSRRGERG